MTQQLVAQIDAVPEADEVAFHVARVRAVQQVRVVVDHQQHLRPNGVRRLTFRSAMRLLAARWRRVAHRIETVRQLKLVIQIFIELHALIRVVRRVAVDGRRRAHRRLPLGELMQQRPVGVRNEVPVKAVAARLELDEIGVRLLWRLPLLIYNVRAVLELLATLELLQLLQLQRLSFVLLAVLVELMKFGHMRTAVWLPGAVGQIAVVQRRLLDFAHGHLAGRLAAGWLAAAARRLTGGLRVRLVRRCAHAAELILVQEHLVIIACAQFVQVRSAELHVRWHRLDDVVRSDGAVHLNVAMWIVTD